MKIEIKVEKKINIVKLAIIYQKSLI